MKMHASVAFVGIFLFFSVALQGCGILGEKGANNEARLPETFDEEAGTARCMGGGRFSCNSPLKEWCAEQEKRCASVGVNFATSCTPQCDWECDDPKCDQVCAPKCGQAICATRCKNFNKQNCEMKCGEPACKVVCPKHFCPGLQCAKCKTECGKPVCKMECAKPDSPCRHICAQPHCKWDCKKPKDCPKPICHMRCQKPRNCMDSTNIVQHLPPLEPGETEVQVGVTAAGAPAPAPASSLLQSDTSAVHSLTSTMRVDITTMDTNFKMQKSQVDLKFAMTAAPAAWTRAMRKHLGEVKESEASCENDNFQCQGDAAWCAEQKTIVCQAADHEQSEEFAEVAEAAQDALQPEELVKVADSADAEMAFLQQRTRKQGRLQA